MGDLYKLWAVFKREYLERVRTRWFVIATIFGPLVFGAMLFLPPWLARGSKVSADMSRIAVLDATGVGVGRRVAVELNGGLAGDTSRTRVLDMGVEDLPLAESTATRAVMRGELTGYLVLDSRTTAGKRARYAGRNATAATDINQIQRAVRRGVAETKLVRAGISPAEALAIMGTSSPTVEAERLTARGRGGSGNINMLFALSVAFLLYVSILIYGQNVLRGVMEEKQTRVAEVVVSSISAKKLLEGKVLGVGAVGLTQILIWVAASVLLTKIRNPVLGALGLGQTPLDLPDVTLGTGALLVVYFVLGYMFYASLFAAVGATVNSEEEAQQAQLPVASLLVMSAVFIVPILVSPDTRLAQVMSWLPFSAPVVMPLRLSITSVPEIDVAMSLLSVVIGCYVAIRIAARIYRTALLMYGKQPTLREVVRWVRYAP